MSIPREGITFHEFIGYLSITMLKLCFNGLLLIFTGQPYTKGVAIKMFPVSDDVRLFVVTVTY